jgi:hypothetical protein
MPNDAQANVIMICSGTGSAPFRAFTERRRRAAPGVGNPHGEPRYVEGSMGAHKFATEADAEAARPSGEEVHKLQDMQTIGRE